MSDTANIPTAAKVFYGLMVFVPLIWFFMFFVLMDLGHLGKNAEDTSGDDNDGVCADACAVSWTYYWKVGLLAPIITFIILWVIAWGIRKAKTHKIDKNLLDSSLMHIQSQKIQVYRKSKKKLIRKTFIAMLIMMALITGGYAIFRYIPLSFLKVKTYSGSKASCKKSWCKAAAPKMEYLNVFNAIALVTGVGFYYFKLRKQPSEEEIMTKLKCDTAIANLNKTKEEWLIGGIQTPFNPPDNREAAKKYLKEKWPGEPTFDNAKKYCKEKLKGVITDIQQRSISLSSKSKLEEIRKARKAQKQREIGTQEKSSRDDIKQAIREGNATGPKTTSMGTQVGGEAQTGTQTGEAQTGTQVQRTKTSDTGFGTKKPEKGGLPIITSQSKP